MRNRDLLDPGFGNWDGKIRILDTSRIRKTIYKIENEKENVKRVPVPIFFKARYTIQNTFLCKKLRTGSFMFE
jgi:hypothetical protein